MTLMGAIVVIVLILFVREEILSLCYRREIKRAQLAYELAIGEQAKSAYNALPCSVKMGREELPSGFSGQEDKDTFYEAA